MVRQTKRRTDEWVFMSAFNVAKARGQNRIVFRPNVVFIGRFACRARIDWCLAEFTEDMIEAMQFAVDQFFLLFNIFR